MSELARALRRRQTDAELRLWQRLRNRGLGGFKFRRQHPFPPFVVDFVCHDCRLIVELDGGQHVLAVDPDERRTSFLMRAGYRVLRFWDNDVLCDVNAVLEEILRHLNTPHPNPLPASGEREKTGPAE